MLATEKNRQIIQQINKIESRIDSLNLTKSKLFQFLLKVQELYQSHSQTIQGQIENFEDLINKKSIYSVQKCSPMKKLAAIYKRILIFVEGTAKLNQIQLEKIDIADQQRQEKLLKKAETFLKSIYQYNKNEQGFNKNFQEYNSHCLKLDQMISKFKQSQNPIVFYNVNVGDDYSKRIDRKNHQCENKETSLVGGLQLLDQKRKILSQNIKEIQENFISLLHYHITNITDAASCLTERGQDEIQILPNPLNFDRVNGDIFTEQIQIFDNKYGKICAGDEILSDLKELFGNSSDAQITSDERLFLDRCEGFTRNKTSSVEEFIYLQKRFIQQIHHKVLASQKLTKEFTALEKAVFKSNGLDDFKKRVRKYFGEGILNITELCFIIIDVPRMRIQKIGKFMQSYYEKMQKCLHKKEEQLKRFKKRAHQVFHDHHNATKSVQNNFASVNKFKSAIEKSFFLFKNYFEQLCKNESEVDVQFQEMIKQIIAFVEKQQLSMKLPNILNKQKEKFLYDLFKNFALDSEIVDIVKQDTRYEILFNDCLKPNLFDQFESKIPKKEFEETKIVLQKKQYQSKGMITKRKIGWCGLRTKKTKIYRKSTNHNIILIQSGKGNYSGILQISKEGISFEEKKSNPFRQRISIRIPKNEILSYETKILMDGQQGVQIQTRMGPVFIQSDEIAQIEKGFEDIITINATSRQQNDSQRDRSNSSSFNKQNNSSTEYRVSFEKTGIGSEYEDMDKNRKSNYEAIATKRLIEQLKISHFFSNLFTVSFQNFNDGNSRIDYRFKDDVNKFLVKEKRFVKGGGPVENSLFLNFNWKVSFPEMQMLKSFTHGEEIKISLTPMLAKVIIIEKNRGQNFLFLHKIFYSEVDKMNKRLTDLVVSIVEREAEVIIEQQRVDLEDSTLNLDVQNLGFEKSQLQSKAFAEIPNGSSCIESDKNSSRFQSKQEY